VPLGEQLALLAAPRIASARQFAQAFAHGDDWAYKRLRSILIARRERREVRRIRVEPA